MDMDKLKYFRSVYVPLKIGRSGGGKRCTVPRNSVYRWNTRNSSFNSNKADNVLTISYLCIFCKLFHLSLFAQVEQFWYLSWFRFTLLAD